LKCADVLPYPLDAFLLSDDSLTLQVVGVCAEELKAAQHWNGPGLLDLIKTIPGSVGLQHFSKKII